MKGYADRLRRPDGGCGGRAPLHRPLLSRATTKVIPNGVDVDRYRRAVPVARWQDGTANILFVGQFEPRKGVLDLLQAYRILRKTGCQCRLLLVGGGPQEREARRYVATRRLHGVEFLGRVSDDEKAQLFRTADMSVSPATGRKSFGIVLLEAMSAGAPIVASDIHGYKGVVRRGIARRCSCLPASPKRSRGPSRACSASPRRRRRCPRPVPHGPRSSAGRG